MGYQWWYVPCFSLWSLSEMRTYWLNHQMKCDFPTNDNTCKRCKAGGHVCIVEGRKPRTAPKWVGSVLFFFPQSVAGFAGNWNNFLIDCRPSRTVCEYSFSTFQRPIIPRVSLSSPLFARMPQVHRTLSSASLSSTSSSSSSDTVPILLDPHLQLNTASSKREYLLAQIRQKDAIIESLLKQVCRLWIIIAFTISDTSAAP